MEKQLEELDLLKEKTKIELKNKLVWEKGSEKINIYFVNISDKINIPAIQLEIKTMVKHFQLAVLPFLNKSNDNNFEKQQNESGDVVDKLSQNEMYGSLLTTYYCENSNGEKVINDLKLKFKKYITFEDNNGEYKNINDEILNMLDLDNINVITGGLLNYFLQL